MAVIVIYGDSNSHGTPPMADASVSERMAYGTRWPDVMAQGLGPAHHVICEGLPGRTTVHDDPVLGGMRNGATVLPAILHTHRPIDLLILLLGTNDLQPRFGVTALEISRSLERLALMARAEDVVGDIVFVAPPPVREIGSLATMFVGAEARQEGLAAQISAVAARLGCGFVDAGRLIEVSPRDGVHWEADAHAVLGAHMAEYVAERLA